LPAIKNPQHLFNNDLLAYYKIAKGETTDTPPTLLECYYFADVAADAVEKNAKAKKTADDAAAAKKADDDAAAAKKVADDAAAK
jgi:hypothetical protein